MLYITPSTCRRECRSNKQLQREPRTISKQKRLTVSVAVKILITNITVYCSGKCLWLISGTNRRQPHRFMPGKLVCCVSVKTWQKAAEVCLMSCKTDASVCDRMFSNLFPGCSSLRFQKVLL